MQEIMAQESDGQNWKVKSGTEHLQSYYGCKTQTVILCVGRQELFPCQRKLIDFPFAGGVSLSGREIIISGFIAKGS